MIGKEFIELPLPEAREAFEREYFIAQITRFKGNISRTAEFVGMDRSSLHRKMTELRIKLRPRKSGRPKKNAPNP